MTFNPYVGAAVSIVLFVALATAVVVQALNASAQQLPGLITQGAMTLIWGGMAWRFWTRARVRRRMQRDQQNR